MSRTQQHTIVEIEGEYAYISFIPNKNRMELMKIKERERAEEWG